MNPTLGTDTAEAAAEGQRGRAGGTARYRGRGRQGRRSERALRYYQQLGLIVPACTTPGGMRRYSDDDLARVARIRELQTLLGLNLDEIAMVLRNEDRMAEIRLAYHDERTSDDERLRADPRGPDPAGGPAETVEAKRTELESFLADLDARIKRARDLLAGRVP